MAYIAPAKNNNNAHSVFGGIKASNIANTTQHVDDTRAEDTSDIVCHIGAEPIHAGVWHYDTSIKHAVDVGESTPLDLIYSQRKRSMYAPMSCVAEHINYMFGRFFDEKQNLEMSNLSEMPWKNDVDIDEKVNNIITYFKTKVVLMKLYDEQLTKWQSSLSEYFDRNDPGAIKEKEIGMLATLHHAYENDIEFERAFDLCNCEPDELTPAFSFGEGRRCLPAQDMVCRMIGGFTSIRNNKSYTLLLQTKINKKLVAIDITNSEIVDFMFAHMKSNDYWINITFNNGVFVKKRQDRYFISGRHIILTPVSI